MFATELIYNPGCYNERNPHEQASNDNSALIVTETTIGKAPYDDGLTDITWEHCNLRRYLNGEFYDRFTDAEKSRIIKTKLTDRNNPWHGTKWGNLTFDKVFLLSYDEIIQYFGTAAICKIKRAGIGRSMTK